MTSRRGDLAGTIGLAIIITAVVGEFAWTAISGVDFTGRGHYTPSERILDGALAVGLGLLAYSTIRTIRRTRKVLATAKASIEANRAAAPPPDEPPPTISYDEAFPDAERETEKED